MYSTTVAAFVVAYFVPCLAFTPKECHDSIGPLALRFLSTKRPYTYQTSNPEIPIPQTCTPVKFWYFGRHGTRYPGDDDILAMMDTLTPLHTEISNSINNSLLCEHTRMYLLSWRLGSDVNLLNESHLHEQGKGELQAIGARYKSRYPDLFTDQFSNDTHYFRATDAERTVSSLKAFASSAFSNTSSFWFPNPIKNDPILKFYSVCEKWKEQVDNNGSSRVELKKFLVSSFMNDTITRVSLRLGLARNLTVEEITIMYTNCAFETAWMNGTLAPWCVAFGVEDFQVLAYTEDLEYYHVDGYGSPVNWESACVVLQDAANFLGEYEANPRNPGRNVQAYFSHSGATLKFLARLGLFNGTEINADNFDNVKDSYVWRTSDIDCMGSNIAFVLLQCEDENDLKLGVLFQEQLVNVFDLQGPYVDYHQFKNKIQPILNTCDFQQICDVDA
ncbi:unnamed protein product [Orchesella dallaii]|uniref:Multiple inositol polyphosphate phosphatase 1 n=1 Tax=Orchesella dallaii TaxID=48710 RepID=A0ABP1RA74_9HEXA